MKQFLTLFCLIVLLNSCTSSKNSTGSSIENTTATSKKADFTIAFGSCNRQDLSQPLWEPIIAHKPDVFIWGGDNIYADTEDMEKLEREYQLQKQNEGYQKLVSNTNIQATWDDHDYGQNDGGSSWEYKKESQQEFLDFLEVPLSDARRSREGVYHSKTYEKENGSVKIILLDTRYFRSALKASAKEGKRYDAGANGTILGEKQWTWLKQELEQSEADFNIIMSSIQVLSGEHGFETWANFPKEVSRLQDLIASTTAKNIVLLSGDRHISEFSRKEMPALNYQLVDFTSSGLTHSYSDFSGEPNKYRVGDVVSDLSFGLLLFDFENKKIRMQMRGKKNEVQQELVQNF
ncbi:alkaline phosphatase D family protein [Salinimicrobium sp. GXAS 041]|uniref:alkaline phosphatase D family protein n=1 Tax=Salinimicrobium sp. GXAS 041 TaxID=3400806 RepID=UPI003C771D17